MPDLAHLPSMVNIPAGDLVPGYLCQAARILLGISQADLRERSMVSKKSINDFENGIAVIGDMLIAKLRAALEEEGAQFVIGDGVIGVLTVKTRSVVDRKSRSPRKARVS